MTTKIDDKKMKSLIEGGIVGRDFHRRLIEIPNILNEQPLPLNEERFIIGYATDTIDVLTSGLVEFNVIWMGHDNWNSTKQSKQYIDKKYSHYCFKCEKIIEYEDVYIQLLRKHSLYDFSYVIDLKNIYSKEEIKDRWKKTKKARELRKYLKILWINDQIEFYCCICYRKILKEMNENDHKIGK